MRKIHTEKEQFLLNESQVYRLRNLYKKTPDTFFEISELTNYYIHFNSRNDLNWFWGNNSATNVIGYSNSKEVKYDKIIKLSDKNVVENYKEKINEYNNTSDYSLICNFLQRMYLNNKWSWLITNKIIIDNKKYLNYSFNLEDLGNAGLFLYNNLENTFSDITAWQKFQSLTKREKEILKLLANGKSSKEISDLYFISENTIRKHRENINRKLELRNIYDLIRFADSFQLIGEL